MLSVILVLTTLFALANLVIMFIMNVYNFMDTIRMNREHKELNEKLDKAMHDVLGKLEEKIQENEEEE